jgi:hypothetical protein
MYAINILVLNDDNRPELIPCHMISDKPHLYIIFNYSFITKTMHFMLIVKNLLSFYVEFEILLHFLLFYRLWNVNKHVNMRNVAWNEMNRTYTKKSSEKHFWIKIVDRNHQIADCNNGVCYLVRSDKKVQKLRTIIFGARSANLQF